MARKIQPFRGNPTLECWKKQLPRALSRRVAATFVLMSTLFLNLASGADSPSRYEYPRLLTGAIYAANSDLTHVLYKFKRTVITSSNSLTAVREYTTPDGILAARETVVYSGDDLVSFELEHLQGKTRATAQLSRPKTTRATITFQCVNTIGAKTNVAIESLRPDTLVSDMIAPFLTAHWDDLLKGKEAKCRYIAPDRAETIAFKFEKHAEASRNGKPVVIVKMSPSNFVIAAFLNPIFLTMERDGDHRVLQYDGRTTPKIPDGNGWKDLDAVTVFDWEATEAPK